MKWTVETDDLGLALKSVLPHAHPNKDDTLLHRVRLSVDPHNLTVSASNRTTAALAIASMWEGDGDDGEMGAIDLHPQDVRELLGLFRGRKKSDDEPDDAMQIEVTDQHVLVTDVSGLFPGKQLRLPRYPFDDQFPNVPVLLAGLLAIASGRADELTVSGAMLGLFAKASAAYGQPLIVGMPPTPAGSVLVSCGESFLGLVAQKRLEAEETGLFVAWREAWHRRIGDGAES